MAVKDLEKRLAQLEAEVAELRTEVARNGRTKDVRGAIEKYKDDEDLLSIFESARKLREADRARARKSIRAKPKKRA